MLKTGAEIFVECLLKEKVKVLFGIPGGSVLSVVPACAVSDEIITSLA